MKAVLMSIHPKWCEKIFNGKKTIEVRKIAPKLETPFKVYVYQTKHRGKPIVSEALNAVYGGGKVVGEFVCDKTRDYIPFGLRGYELPSEWLKKMCLSKEQLDRYGGLKTLRGLHITEPKRYDMPKELGEFKTPDKPYHEIIERDGTLMFMDGYVSGIPIKRPPQSWQYVEEA